ncbi:hypothetical protein OOU_Y34scaffold00240g22 [Pyricularia oryzae Y34]|uniref:Uncharacterized protein n=2 Tax=Pyricularia oryzae TaxID=318829 RepID=A0AA97P4V8_PYRO3|nr:hypothetical protein OOU_Y34scaffold00240g22 [Pyricularia oryzae Y34]
MTEKKYQVLQNIARAVRFWMRRLCSLPAPVWETGESSDYRVC